ncbi:SDR family NAD(P)-dependent oxidoreductase, partial [Amycolatopsis anabasis]|uniref:SDR family NAD(P)-dependent oxidoreductase n=1 Tax=Amycolatopsis anabasis TaxID=1840409 RepID=UPI00131DED26
MSTTTGVSRTARQTVDRGSVVVLSARTPERLRAVARALLDAVSGTDRESPALRDIAYTLQVGRDDMRSRLGFVAADVDDVRERLRRFLDAPAGTAAPGVAVGEVETPAPLQRAGADVSGVPPEEVLRRWLGGAVLDWDSLYDGQDGPRPRIVALPTYPFARERYWAADALADEPVDGPAAAETAVASKRRHQETGQAASASSLPDGVWLYDEDWVAAPLAKSAPCSGAVLVVTPDDTAFGAGELTGCSCTVTFAAPDADGVARGLDRLTERHGRVAAVVLDLAGEGLADPAAALAVVRGIASAGQRPERLVIAARFRDAHERCYGEAWVGFTRSLRMPLPGVRSTTVMLSTVDLPETSVWSRLHDELVADPPADVLLDGGRHVLRASPVELAAPVPRSLRRGGVYLITGGTGGIGRLVAEWLLRDYGAAVVLTGRHERGRRAAVLDELERLAGTSCGCLVYEQADVTDAADMRAVVERIDSRFGGLDCVFHVAGVGSVGSVVGKGVGEFSRVVGPKVGGL